MKYYPVVSRFYDSGRTYAKVLDPVEAEDLPESTMRTMVTYDIYTDYFEDITEARAFVKDTLNA